MYIPDSSNIWPNPPEGPTNEWRWYIKALLVGLGIAVAYILIEATK